MERLLYSDSGDLGVRMFSLLETILQAQKSLLGLFLMLGLLSDDINSFSRSTVADQRFVFTELTGVEEAIEEKKDAGETRDTDDGSDKDDDDGDDDDDDSDFAEDGSDDEDDSDANAETNGDDESDDGDEEDDDEDDDDGDEDDDDDDEDDEDSDEDENQNQPPFKRKK